MVVVTHERNFEREVADRVVFMENDVIIEEAESKEFFRCPEPKRFLRRILHDYDYSIQD